MPTKVPKIADVNVELSRGETNQLFVVAWARVPKYLNIQTQLSPYFYLVPPADGIYDFDFTANIPDGFIPNTTDDVLITAATLIASPDSNPVKGVRVHGTANNIVTRVPTATTAATSDEFKINQVTTKNDKLVINVQYTGGCERHDFELIWDGSYLESFPPVARMRLVHNSNGDPCKALPTEDLQFDLLDLDPCIIKLTTDFGYEASIPFKVAPPNPPAVSPFGPGGIPIIDDVIQRLVVSMVNKNFTLDQFRDDPVAAMTVAGLNEKQISMLNGSTGILNGSGGICHQPLNGFGGIVARIGERLAIIDAICRLKS